jgi:hypothetical protein
MGERVIFGVCLRVEGGRSGFDVGMWCLVINWNLQRYTFALGLGMRGEMQKLERWLHNLKMKFISLSAVVVLDAISGLGARLALLNWE